MNLLKKQKGNVVGALLVLGIVLLLAVGYVKNIVAIFGAGAFTTWSGMEIARVIGVFIPFIGSVLGFF